MATERANSIHTRVLVLIHTTTFGGPHNQVLRLNDELLRSGIKQIVMTPPGPGDGASRLRSAGIDVIPSELVRPRKVLAGRVQAAYMVGLRRDVGAIRRVIRQCSIDVVQICGLLNWQGALAARREGVGLVWQLLSTWSPWVIRAITSPFVATADVIMTVGRRVAQGHPGIRRAGSKTVVFFPPVDTNRFRPRNPMRTSVRDDLNVGDRLVIGTVGNRNKMKAHERLVAAAGVLKDRGLEEEIAIRVVGQPTPEHASYYAEEVIGKASSLGLSSDFFQFVTPTHSIEDYLSAFDVFVLTSRAEGVPTAMLEAMSASLPVVATDVGGVSEVLSVARAGAVVSPRDVQALAGELEVLVRDRSRREDLGRRGRDFILAKAAIPVVAEVHRLAYSQAQARLQRS